MQEAGPWRARLLCTSTNCGDPVADQTARWGLDVGQFAPVTRRVGGKWCLARPAQVGASSSSGAAGSFGIWIAM